MEVYIEKAVLDQLNKDFLKDDLSLGQQKLKDILYSYDGITFYTDFIFDAVQFENYKLENMLFTKIVERNVITGLSYIEFVNSASFSQTFIVGMEENLKYKDVERKGALCFTYGNYQEKISTIINKCHDIIDFSEGFIGWDCLTGIKVTPFNKIIINDGYILADKTGQKIDDNLIPIIKTIVGNKYDIPINIEIFTNDLNPKKPGTAELIKAEAEKKINRLNNVFSNYNIEFTIISNTLKKWKYDFHDRLIYLNFLLIDSPSGFNQMPFNKEKKSTSQIRVETIFNKHTYKRLKNHIKLHDDYFNEIKRLETLNFKYI